MAGIRVITYTDSDARKVAQLIQSSFEILPSDVVDKTKELGIDRVGYRSIHCVGTLGESRLKLPENSKFRDMALRFKLDLYYNMLGPSSSMIETTNLAVCSLMTFEEDC